MFSAQRILQAGINSAKTAEARSRLESVELCFAGYAEPGYTDPASGVIAFGNWNVIYGRWDNEKRESTVLDGTPRRVGELLERAGVELEWSDEWCCCSECGKAFRTSPDSYSWKPAYVEYEGSILCEECLKSDAGSYLESLEGDTTKCVPVDLDLEEYGYTKLEGDFEHGLHYGMDADPKVIGKSLRNLGVNRFIFRLDSTSQFNVDFSVWVHESELSKFSPEQWDKAAKDGPSVSAALDRALRSASQQMSKLPDGQGVKVAKCHADGTADVRVISPQDFIEGKALQD